MSRARPSGPTHVLPEPALARAELPKETRRLLLELGVPREVRLEGWTRPTVFTSELGGGEFPDPRHYFRRGPAPADVYLIGAERETEGYPHARAAFGLQKGTGAVLRLDAVDPAGDRFVNGSLAAFLASLALLVEAWDELRALPERAPVRPAVEGLAEELSALDPRALEGPDRYWADWLDELGARD